MLLLVAAGAIAVACGKGSGDGRAVDSHAVGGEVTPTAGPSAAAKPACAADNGGITLPAGFCATIFDDRAGTPRHIVVAPNGDVFVNRSSARSGGGVLALRDTNGDGQADVRETFGSGTGTGIGLVPGWLYVEHSTRIVRYPMTAGRLTPNGEPEVIVTGLPTGGHDAHPFVLDGKGNLFVDLGSPSNSCQQSDRQNRSPGKDPCPELTMRAGIWRFDANKQNQEPTATNRYATGLRNAEGLAVHPGDGALYSTSHGRDQLSQNWGFTDQQSAELPAEELFKVDQGTDGGWPYCYYDQFQKKKVLAPEYGGDGKQVGRCAGKAEPAVAFPGHWAPMATLFYTGRAFPAKYRDGAFVAFHGSWNRLPLPQAGFRVAFAPMSGGKFTGAYETFADGFAGGEIRSMPNAAAHRPSGLAQSPDGGIYVTDDAKGRIWKIVYVGR
ncbi:L-sorbosone dehydrogenase [Gemmatirosa kalamazoonensis]|uniref:L-sorbosone dehydrogenase n=1 Tax=Gemmatirosa kalamazoonensis TaxID=861299 RepID=W0RLT6_9BACT|nr:PQQ-dependent sugar dehydrogenase [Gemmatirosa kalamazoonensis]AHG90403.1 L-sorbosone dehydrogenase [Gemmatirosa kalamazoonensis]